MPETPVIDRNNILPHAQDYSFLRTEGISLIQSLSGETWTDYNTHDPGITLLELLCYALTDLGYRSGFDVADILSSTKPDQQNWEQIFYTARQALPCNPLTLLDYRKLIIDTEGVRNAWIEKSDDYEIIIYMQKAGADTEKQHYTLTYDPAGSVEALRLRGLYKVFVDYEENIIKDNRQDEVADIIRKKLQFHRNLCEDFLTVSSIEYEYFPVEAVIQVNEGTDIDMINAKIYKVINDLFSPPVTFYSLEQMLQRKTTGDEIFKGPVLKYGFIDSDELERSERNTEIHLSDVIRLVSAIEGVIAVKKFTFGTSDSPFPDFGTWVNSVRDAQKAPKLDFENSTVSFERSGDRHRTGDKKRANRDRVRSIFSFFQAGDFKTRLKGIGKDFKVPAGEYMNIEDYYPAQLNLPAAYGMNENLIDDQLDDVAVLNASAELFDASVGPDLRRIITRLMREFPDDRNILDAGKDLFEETASGSTVKKTIEDLVANRDYAAALSRIASELYGDSKLPLQERLNAFVDKKPHYSPVTDKAEVLGKLATAELKKPLFEVRSREDIGQLRTAYIHFQVKRSGKRRKQILQLRGFLMVFEQIMANHLSQLSHIRELLSFDEKVVQSYYPQVVNEIRDLEALFIDFEKYRETQLQLMESENRFISTRNNILDHLMSRFSESMDKYAFFMQNYSGKAAGKKLIRDKVALLSDYVQLSGYRGSGFNYTDPQHAWNSRNVEGMKKRVSRLLGIENYRRRTIAPGAISVKEITLDGQTIARHVTTLVDPDNADEVMLTSVDYEFESEARELLNYMLEEGSDAKLYELEGKKDKWSFKLKKATQERDFEVVAFSREYATQAERDEAFNRTLEVLNRFSADENFHVLEHILLRPKVGPREGAGRRTAATAKADTVDLLTASDVPAGKEVTQENNEEVPYKFRITQVKDQAKKDRTVWKLSLKKEDDELLVVNEEFSFYKHLTRRIIHIRESGADIASYQVFETTDGNYKFRLLSGDRYLAEGKKSYRRRSDLDEEIENLAQFFSFESGIINRQVDDDNIAYYADPYSLQVSVIIPTWHKRFRVPAFRHLLEKTIYLETPSHIYPNIYWLDHKEMQDFEEAYKLWIEELASLEIPDTDAEIPDTDIVNKMISALNELRKQNQ